MPIRPFLLLFVALLSVPASEPAGGTDLPAAWFVDAALAIQDGRAPVAQAKDWQQRLAKASAGDRTLLFTLLAAWRRTYPGRPDWALTGLAPLLSGRAAPTSDAAPPLGPDGKPRPWADLLGANGPAAWRIERPLVMLHAELGRSLAALGEIEALVALVDRWREASGQDRLVQAAMATALADGMLRGARTDQAVELADRAQGILSQLLAEPYGETAERRLALALLEPLRAEAHRRQDLDRYGPAWVAYREADQARLREADPFLAQVRYAAIERDFSGGLLALAARSNRLVLQLECARSDRADDRMAWLDRQQTRLEQMIANAQDLRRLAVGAPETVARQQALLSAQKDSLQALGRWPAKPEQAGARALDEAQAFVAEDPDGLYRCDVLFAMADWTWEEEGDAAQGGRQYEHLVAWLDRVPQRDAALDALELDLRLRTVAAPPAAAVIDDEWGNTTWSTPQPGAIVNHRTCPWLAGHLLMRANAKAGLCAFARGDRKAALAAIDRMAGHDPFEALRKQGQEPVSNVSRLRDGFANGRMFATADELALFRGRELAALLAGELAFECEEWDVARKAYRSLLERFGPRLKPEQRMYVEFMLANCQLFKRTGDRNEAVVILRRLGDGPDTAPTWARAQLALFDYLRWDEPTEVEAFAILDHVLASRCSQYDKDRTLWLKTFLIPTKGDPILIARRQAWLEQLTASQNPEARGAAATDLANPYSARLSEDLASYNMIGGVVHLVQEFDDRLASGITGLERDRAILAKAYFILYEFPNLEGDSPIENSYDVGRALLKSLSSSDTPWVRRAAAAILEDFPASIPDPTP